MKKIKELFASDYEFCSKTHFSVIKGISIFVVVLVHLCNRYSNFTYLSPFAGAAVAVFLLCSGYGLSESFLKKQGLQGYWPNKIVKIWLPSFLKLSFFAIVTLSGLNAWLTEYPLFLYGWYLQVLFAEYLVFWLLFRFVKKRNLCLIGLFAVSVIAFLLLKSQLYAEQVFCFPIGVAFSQLNWKKAMEKWGFLKHFLLIGVCCVLTAGAFVLRNRFSNYLLFNGIWMVFKLSIAALICLIPYYMRKLRFLGVFIPLGSISYMLYLINNDILALLEGNTYWYTVILVLVLLICSAVVFKWICDMLAGLYEKIANQKNVKEGGTEDGK